jgi:hypothetical protein
MVTVELTVTTFEWSSGVVTWIVGFGTPKFGKLRAATVDAGGLGSEVDVDVAPVVVRPEWGEPTVIVVWPPAVVVVWPPAVVLAVVLAVEAVVVRAVVAVLRPGGAGGDGRPAAQAVAGAMPHRAARATADERRAVGPTVPSSNERLRNPTQSNTAEALRGAEPLDLSK